MKTAVYTLVLTLLLGCLEVRADLPSPIKASPISGDNSIEAIARAKAQGTASAKEDIKKGIFRILYYGEPWDMTKPLIDSGTGYRIQMVAGCLVSPAFTAEVEAYNHTMKATQKDRTTPASESR